MIGIDKELHTKENFSASPTRATQTDAAGPSVLCRTDTRTEARPRVRLGRTLRPTHGRTAYVIKKTKMKIKKENSQK
jgi:hypothetical protein